MRRYCAGKPRQPDPTPEALDVNRAIDVESLGAAVIRTQRGQPMPVDRGNARAFLNARAEIIGAGTLALAGADGALTLWSFPPRIGIADQVAAFYNARERAQDASVTP